jgi:hypothetical protein
MGIGMVTAQWESNREAIRTDLYLVGLIGRSEATELARLTALHRAGIAVAPSMTSPT